MAGNTEVLPKGTIVEGHIEAAKPHDGRAVLALTLDCVDVQGQRYAVSTNTVARTGQTRHSAVELADVFTGAANATTGAISVPADSIVAFTLTKTLTA
jgi:hypothetical protein